MGVLVCSVIFLAWLFHSAVYVPTLGMALFFIPSLMMDLPFKIIFLSWDMYDIYIAKKSNEGLIVNVPALTQPTDSGNSESEWGFGQIFPMIMMLSLLLGLMDAFLSSTQGLHRNSVIAPRHPHRLQRFGIDGSQATPTISGLSAEAAAHT